MLEVWESWDALELEVYAADKKVPVPTIHRLIILARGGPTHRPVEEILRMVDHLKVPEATLDSWCQTMVGFRWANRPDRQQKLVPEPPAPVPPVQAYGAWGLDLYKGLIQRHPWGLKYLPEPGLLVWAYENSPTWKGAPDHFRLWILKHEACPQTLLVDVVNRATDSQFRLRAIKTLMERNVPVHVTVGTGIENHEQQTDPDPACLPTLASGRPGR